MREILYKGKSIKTGQWIHGYFFKTGEQCYILWGTKNDIPNMIEVDPKTVCQYTGKNDKNGNKIFDTYFNSKRA